MVGGRVSDLPDLKGAKEVFESYVQKDSTIDMGNLWFAANEYYKAFNILAGAMLDIEHEWCRHNVDWKRVDDGDRQWCTQCHEWIRSRINPAEEALNRVYGRSEEVTK